jgi:hypothetical protein
MPKYRVTVDEVATYEVIVDAADEKQAVERANEKLANSPRSDFPCSISDLEVVYAEEIVE